jgi:hypothetical protein
MADEFGRMRLALADLRRTALVGTGLLERAAAGK